MLRYVEDNTIAIDECGSDYSLVFDSPQNANLLELEEGTRLLTGKRVPYLEAEREIPLSDHYFDDGPKLLDGIDAEYITLKSKKSGRFVELGIKDFPYLCQWGVRKNIDISSWIGCLIPNKQMSRDIHFRRMSRDSIFHTQYTDISAIPQPLSWKNLHRKTRFSERLLQIHGYEQYRYSSS